MKIARLYLRVSTIEQSNEGYSIQAQKERLISYCKAKDYLVGDIYIDGGFSGSNLDRPAMDKMLEDIKTKDTDIVVVYKLDRISRSQKDTLYLIEDVFLKNNIDFVSMQESFDTATPFGRAMIGILSVFAQLERENIKERSKMGRIERAKKGLWCGTPNPPLGYDLIDSNLIVNEYEAIQVKEVFELYLQGLGKQRIQNRLIKKGYTNKYGDWSNISSHAIVRIIRNRAYVGDISYAKEWYTGIHDPIIDEKTFEDANNMRIMRKGASRNIKHFLSGLLVCKECGAKYITDSKNNTSYYVCRNRKYGYKQDFKCMNTIFKTKELEEVARKKIKKMVLNKDKTLRDKYKQMDSEEEDNDNTVIVDRLKDIDKQINKLMDLYQLDTIPIETFSDRIEKLHEEKKTLSKEVTIDKAQVNINIEEILNILENFDSMWGKLDVLEKKDIATVLIGNEITIDNKGI